jgi:hypothetical protein
MRRFQVLLTKQLGAADLAKWKIQSGFSIFRRGFTPIGLITSGRIGPLGGRFMPGYPG